MRFSRRALIFSAAGGFILPLVPLLIFAHACSLDEFEPIPRSTSSASTSASTTSSVGGGVSVSVGGGGGSDGGSDGGDSGERPTCPSDMAEIHAVGSGFCIDRYEVTRGDYATFLKVADAGPAPPDVCAWNSFSPTPPQSPPSLPVAGVDWCDAWAYCASKGKRLCGSVDGGAVSLNPDLRSFSEDEWQVACSNGVTTVYPYGNSFVSGRCSDCNPKAGCAPDGLPEAGPDGNAPDVHIPAPAEVGAFSDCVANGAYDLSGNVAEWEDSCAKSAPDDAGKPHPENDTCSARGGSFKLPNAKLGSSCLACSVCIAGGTTMPRNRRSDDVGFRCCKDLE